MAHSLLLITRTANYELAYNNGQTTYKPQINMEIRPPQPEVTLFTPDDSSPSPIKIVDGLGQLTAEITIRASNDRDELTNALMPLTRALHGRHSEAVQSSIYEETDPVVLRVQLDGMTNYTDFVVLHGFVDSGRAYYGEAAIGNKNITLWRIPTTLTLLPGGQGETFALRNELTGSPGMLLEGTTAGLAAGLTAVGSPTSYKLDITRGLLGQCQKMTVPSTGTVGFETATVSVARGTAAAAYAWINQDSGNKITVTLMDGGGNTIEAKEFANASPTANADYTATDFNGHTWYRIRVSGTNSAASGIKLRVARDTSDAASSTTWYTCLLYLQTTDSLNLLPYPLMDVDSDGDGVVDGWENDGHALVSMSNVFYFSSSYSQQIGDLAGVSKIISDPIAVNPGLTTNFSCWVRSDGGADTTLALVDHDQDETEVASVTIPAAMTGHDTSQTGDDTNTWYKFSLSYTPTAPTRELNLRVKFSGTANNLYIDNVSLWQGSGVSDLSTVRAWSSPHQPYNRHNPTTSNPERINTIDVWGVHGDMPAIMTGKFQVGGADKQRFYFSRWIDGTYRAIDRLHVLAAYQSGSDWTADGSPSATNGAWSTPSDSATNTGTTLRFTASGGTGSGSYELTSITYPHSIERLLASVRRAFLQAKASSTSAVMTVTIKAGPADNQITLLSATSVSVGTTGQLQILDLGLNNGLGLLARAKKRWSLGANYTVTFTVASVPNSGTVDFDCVWLLPIDESGEFLLAQTQDDGAAAGRSFLWLFGAETAVSLQGQIEEPNASGSMYHLTPGVVNRIAILQTESNNETDVTDYMRATLYVTPRASHLLGTE
jgi:hypothetical protein